MKYKSLRIIDIQGLKKNPCCTWLSLFSVIAWSSKWPCNNQYRPPAAGGLTDSYGMLLKTMWSSRVICSASSIADNDSKHSAFGQSAWTQVAQAKCRQLWRCSTDAHWQHELSTMFLWIWGFAKKIKTLRKGCSPSAGCPRSSAGRRPARLEKGHWDRGEQLRQDRRGCEAEIQHFWIN